VNRVRFAIDRVGHLNVGKYVVEQWPLLAPLKGEQGLGDSVVGVRGEALLKECMGTEIWGSPALGGGRHL